MSCDWFGKWRYCCLATCIGFLFSTGVSRAGDNESDLRRLLEQQSKQIDQQRQQLEQLRQRLDTAEAAQHNGKTGEETTTADDNPGQKSAGEYPPQQAA